MYFNLKYIYELFDASDSWRIHFVTAFTNELNEEPAKLIGHVVLRVLWPNSLFSKVVFS
jgi:hypothetical protein